VRPADVVAVSSELPWPLNSGGHLRAFHLLRAIAGRFRVHLIAASDAPSSSAIDALAAADISAETVVVRRRTAVDHAIMAAAAAIRREPYVLYRRHLYRAMRRRVTDVCAARRPSILYLDHLDSFTYRACCPSATVVADLHNVYSLIAQREAEEGSGLLKRYLAREASLLRRAERQVVRNADLVFAVSESEAAYYRQAGGAEVEVVPNGVDCGAYRMLPTGRPSSSLIVYVGSMSWRPNADAAIFLASSVLPAVRQRCPEARLRIIGRDPGMAVSALGSLDGVEVTGEVEAIAPHLMEAAVLAVPLAVGGGTRLKILEALAAGVPVVSTAVGAEGLDLVSGVHLLIAERERFAESIVRLLTDRPFGTARAEAGRTAVREKYDWVSIGQRASTSIARCLGDG